jgi:hypothetical protein
MSPDRAPGRNYIIALAVLFALALGVRLVFIHQCRFAGDEARFYSEARSVVAGEAFPALGTAVTGGEARLPGGTFTLLMVPAFLFSRSPLAGNVMVVLFSLLAYWLLVSVVRRWMGERVSLVFAVLILFSPWSYFYSDRIWNPNVLILLTALLLWAATKMIDHPRSKQVFWIPVVVMVAPQFHLSGIVLLLLAVLLFFAYRPKIHKWASLAGIGAGVLCYLPYLISEIQSGFRNTKLLMSMPSDPTFAAAEFYRGPLNLLIFASGEMGYLLRKGFWFPYNEMQFYFQQDGLTITHNFYGGSLGADFLVTVTLISLALALAALVFWLVGLFRSGKGIWKFLKTNPLYLGFALALVLTPLLLLLGKKSYHPHYIYFFYPFAFVPLLALFSRFDAGRFVAVLVWVGVAALCQTVASAHVYQRSERPISFPQQRKVMEFIYATSNNQSFAIDFRLTRSRFDTHPFHVLAHRYFEKPFRENHRAKLRYTIFDWKEGRWFLESGQPTIRGRPVNDYRDLPASVVVKSGG